MPPRLQLPPLNDVLNRPPQPNDVPSVTDVRDAIRYEKEAFAARSDNKSDDAALVEAVIYKANVIQAKAGEGGAAPPWFHAAMTAALAPVNHRLDAIEQRLTTIEQRLTNIEQSLTNIERTQAIIYHRGCAREEARPFVMVPFLNGTDPTADDDDPLPLLSSAAIVGNSRDQESRRYYRGYRRGGGAFPTEATRKAHILQAIGCEVFQGRNSTVRGSIRRLYVR